jgi:hypothetical protein
MAVYSESHRKRVSRLCGQNLTSELTWYAGRVVAESVTGLFPRRTGLIPRPEQVRFLFDEVTLGQEFVRL